MSDPADRRQSARYPVTSDTTCSSVARVTQDLGTARVKNISMEGIGLLLSTQVEAGSSLVLTIVNKPKSFSKTVIVKVVHVTQQGGGTCLIGGTFETPLTYQELSALVM